VIVGGIDMMTQSLMLAKKPHIVVATPGRLVDHLENTKGFNLKSLRYLVMDEADRILNMDFETEVRCVYILYYGGRGYISELEGRVVDDVDDYFNLSIDPFSLPPKVDKILKVIPRQRVTYLYSATMTKKVQKLHRASLHNPIKIEVSTKYVEQIIGQTTYQ